MSDNYTLKVIYLLHYSKSIIQDQDEFIIRDTNLGDAALVASDRANLEFGGYSL